MLVISRSRDQIVRIGDDIQIMVVDIRGDNVRLGITAPRETRIDRQEVYEAIQREQGGSHGSAPGEPDSPT